MKKLFLCVLVCSILTSCNSVTDAPEVLKTDSENSQNESIPSPSVEPTEKLEEHKQNNNLPTGNVDTEATQDNPSPTDSMEAQTNSFKWDDGAIAAMVFFDYQGSDLLGGKFENWPLVYDAYAEAYSIFKDVPISDAKTLVLPGDEVYCIIPRYKNTRIIAAPLEWPIDSENDNMMVVGDSVFDEITKAFIMNCNVSDLFSNVQITIEAGDQKTTFSPSISLRDGAVVADDSVQVLYLEGVYAPVLESD